MVENPTLRNHAAPVCHVSIIAECENARRRQLSREEGLGPRLGCVGGRPGPLAVASQAMDENNARSVSRLVTLDQGRRTRRWHRRGI
jgi:hypothetical protein